MLAFPRLSKIIMKSEGHCGAAGHPGKGLFALGNSIPFYPLMWSQEHQNLLNKRLSLSRHCKKGHNSNPSNKSILFLRNTEEQKGWGREEGAGASLLTDHHTHLHVRVCSVWGTHATCPNPFPEPGMEVDTVCTP